MTDDEIEALMRATYTSGYPDDLRRLVAKVRRDALEEAAKACESIASDIYGMTNPREFGECAASIRALATGNTR